MKLGGPYNIVAGQQTEITPPDNQSYAWVVIFNSITTEQEVTYGPNAQWLQPLMANQYNLPSPSTAIYVNPQSTEAAGTALGTITAAWYLTNEQPPSGYPLPITASDVTIPSGTAVTITGQPIDVAITSTTTVPSTKTESVLCGTAVTTVYSNTTGGTQFCTGIVVANTQTVSVGVTVALDGNDVYFQIPAGDSKIIPLPYPFELPNNTSITGMTTSGSATVSAIVTG